MAGAAPIVIPRSSAASAGKDLNDVKHTAPLVVLTTLFFTWGFITCLNDILSPHLKAIFSLNYFQTGLVQTAFFGAYFVMSLPSGYIVKTIGYKRGIIVGLGGAAVGCLLFYPAAGARSFGLFLLALFVLASGITLLQVAANPFVAVLGKPETASSRLTLTQAFNSLGTAIAPKFGKWAILSTAALGAAEIAKMSPTAEQAYKLAEAQSVQKPYLALAAALVVLAVAIAMFRLPRIEDTQAAPTDGVGDKSAWSHPHLVFGALAIFVYVGAECAIGNYLINYFEQPYMGGLTAAKGADLVLWYWTGAMIGRFIGTVTLRLYRPGRVLAIHAACACALTVVTMLTVGTVGTWSILAVGLFNSIMFPTIFTLAIDGLGNRTGQGSGILCMAIVGGALIPPLMGKVADTIGIHYCFAVATVCYVYIVWYGVRGSVPARRAAAA